MTEPRRQLDKDRHETDTDGVCGQPHHDHPESLCTEPAGHYKRLVDPHAAPLVINGRECGAVAWDEPSA